MNDIYNSSDPYDIAGFTVNDYDMTQRVIGGGVIYSFSKAFHVQLDYLFKSSSNANASASDYTIQTVRMLTTASF